MTVRLAGVSVAYNGHRAVDEVAFTVEPGEWLGLIGPNGAGKSTVLKAIAGAVPFEGSIVVAPAPAGRRRSATALVPQQPSVPTGMQVVDYVLLGRTAHIPLLGTESPHDLDVVAEALDALHLADLAHRHVETLSGGEFQRAILARALVQDAPVLLLDEPTASLDIGHQLEVFRLVDALRRERDLVVIAAVHDLTLAARFCDRLALMSGGRIVAAGAPGDVVSEENVKEHFGADVAILRDARYGLLVVPGPADGSAVSADGSAVSADGSAVSADGDPEEPSDPEADGTADDADGEVLEA